ncbi:MAG: hypothetical protein CO186_08165 [Zetaproteobacteria bacterium CG_4_9_14_3_um_filter_49_83]|nr:MAG: hypothetical protein COW62_03175 [Zetaproteobacteria bacterium CG17_big_fil_post_rev_8_21_14_2_50_50_13]PIV29140.1 MAG: hypothetical protein COS35_13635 [Zetaproteobacteria bacterium CG02_land_8_20_14_3_00_50_9]PIY55892.1 MAG: hypothetical protein COZ00_07165 [Zetaproteobacteria bacterium CG_4_10_14_0_8_um_filter_49_80]PJA35022.1 MAG: hypothetical protein CO186_08165 [Zetaproteobacteria bacterium CG_4_9_14_3_um_filter_49_83]
MAWYIKQAGCDLRGETRVNFLVIDDHPLIRSSINTLLTDHFLRAACFESASAEDGMRYLSTHQIGVVLLDLTLPGMGGFEALRCIRQYHPDTFVLILSASNDLYEMQRCIDAGAAGFVNKGETGPVIISAINTILKGEKYIPLILQGQGTEIAKKLKLAEKITQRQRDVLRLLQHGKSNSDIASSLGLTESTVKVYCRDLYKLMGVNNRHQAMQEALRIGLLD